MGWWLLRSSAREHQVEFLFGQTALRSMSVAPTEFESVMAEQGRSSRPAINPAFKLVFLTAAGGTALFVAICVATTLWVGKDPPPLLDKTISSLFDMAKIGFGAVAGLLGGHTLKQDSN